MVTCDNPSISEQELLNSLLVRDTDSSAVGLRVKFVSADAADIEPVIGCTTIPLLNSEQILRYAVGLSDSGKPAIIFIEEA